MSWQFFALCSMLSYCLFFVCVKFSVDRVDVALMRIIQTWITGVFLIAILLITTHQPIEAQILAISKRDWGFITLSAFAYSISWILFLLALKCGPLAKIMAIARLDVIVTIFLSAFFFGEQITLQVLAGAALMLCGISLITSV
jgi:transporter family protein